jgi:hypothetical protein
MAIEFESTEARSIEEIAEDLAKAIHWPGSIKHPVERTKELLVEFAEEIKREAIEP